jgi:ATP-dependent helicase Lhr and Lhr-like helicase
MQSKEWRPFPFQKEAWRTYLRGEDVLIHSATGTGKTAAAWMGPLLQWCHDPIPKSNWTRVQGRGTFPPLMAIWITPLRALAGDTYQALDSMLQGMQIPWSLESRTGDTSASTKQRQKTKLPSALITTPESLTLLLSYPGMGPLLQYLRAIVVDEWHELIGSKRGVLLELALSQLRRIAPQVQTLGLSATLGNVEQSFEVLRGPLAVHAGRIIHGQSNKKMLIESAIPSQIERFPWAGHLGIRMVPRVIEAIDKAKSSLIFTNTRNQTELWYQELLLARKDYAGQLALHHGSLATEVRNWVEQALRDDRLRGVVCTSSLDLGVDFTAVDQVIQIGSPKGIARLLQRAGRSGHQPGAISRLLFVPTNALELLELAAARKMMKLGRLESREPESKPLDVLAQHLVSRGLASPYGRNEVLEELRTTYAYANLTADELDWVVRFAKHGGDTLARYEEFSRLEEDEHGILQVSNPKVARRHRMSIGTIVSEVAIQVRFMNGKNVGTVEESFLSRIRIGDRFLLAGKLLELVQLRDSVAWVKKGSGTPTAVPRWMGGRLSLSSQLSLGIRELIDEACDGIFESPELRAVRSILELQKAWSHLPRTNELLVERIKTREGYQLFLFPFEGRLVHEGLAAVLAHRLSRGRKQTFSLAANDYGIVLQSSKDPEIDCDRLKDALTDYRLLDDMLEGLNATEMCKRQFREIARIAGLIQTGFPGDRRSGRQLQASSDLIYGAFQEYDPENLLLHQARTEVLSKQLEWSRMQQLFERIRASELIWCEPARITPFAFGLLVDRLRERVSTESLADRVRRMQEGLEQSANEESMAHKKRNKRK